MVPATIAHRKDLIKNIEDLEPGGTSELEYGFLDFVISFKLHVFIISDIIDKNMNSLAVLVQVC